MGTSQKLRPQIPDLEMRSFCEIGSHRISSFRGPAWELRRLMAAPALVGDTRIPPPPPRSPGRCERLLGCARRSAGRHNQSARFLPTTPNAAVPLLAYRIHRRRVRAAEHTKGRVCCPCRTTPTACRACGGAAPRVRARARERGCLRPAGSARARQPPRAPQARCSAWAAH